MAYLICDVCNRGGFKSKAGLAGHKKIAHGVDIRKTVPDEIGKRLQKIEQMLIALMFDKLSRDCAKRAVVKGFSLDKIKSSDIHFDYKDVQRCIELYVSGDLSGYTQALDKFLEPREQ